MEGKIHDLKVAEDMWSRPRSTVEGGKEESEEEKVWRVDREVMNAVSAADLVNSTEDARTRTWWKIRIQCCLLGDRATDWSIPVLGNQEDTRH